MWMSCCSKDKKANNNAFKKVKREMLKLLHHDQDYLILKTELLCKRKIAVYT